VNKNPSEIRLELLETSKELLFSQYYQEREHLCEKWNMEFEFAKMKGDNLPPQPNYPKFPTHTQIIEVARSFSEYVSNS